MTPDELIEHYITVAATAATANTLNMPLTAQAVGQWRKRGKVPQHWQFVFEKLTRGKLKADLK